MINPPLAQLAEATVLRTVQSEFESLKGDHPFYVEPEWKVYGPYQREDSRRHVICYNGYNKITVSYPKFLMECKLKRFLEENEEVHHKNEIESDDRLENFEVVNSTLHKKFHKTNDTEWYTCPICNIPFSLVGIQLSNRKRNERRRPNMKGPYCSRSCSGKENN